MSVCLLRFYVSLISWKLRTMMEQIPSLSHNTRVPGSIVTSGFFLMYGFVLVLLVSVWVSSRVSGFFQPQKRLTGISKVPLGVNVVCARWTGVLCSMCRPIILYHNSTTLTRKSWWLRMNECMKVNIGSMVSERLYNSKRLTCTI